MASTSSSGGGGIDELFKGQVSETAGNPQVSLNTRAESGLDAFGQPKRFDRKGRRLAGGTTNLLQG